MKENLKNEAEIRFHLECAAASLDDYRRNGADKALDCVMLDIAEALKIVSQPARKHRRKRTDPPEPISLDKIDDNLRRLIEQGKVKKVVMNGREMYMTVHNDIP